MEQGRELPEKPVAITFDDGYLSNMTIGLPVLEKYRMHAAIFAIGCSVGKDTYKDTGEAMTPHFSAAQAKEMIDTGYISIGSHGYNLHEVEGRDPAPIRMGILQKEGETEDEYVEFLLEDCRKFNEVMEEAIGHPADALAYPHGLYSTLSKVLLQQMGIDITLTTQPGTNTIIKGLPQSLLDLKRYQVGNDMTGRELLELLESEAVK